MNSQENNHNISIESSENRSDKLSRTESGRFIVYAIASMILAIAAWFGAYYNAWLGIGLCIFSIISGALALKSHRNGVRNTAITSIIAAAVLLVVAIAFMVVIYIGLKSV